MIKTISIFKKCFTVVVFRALVCTIGISLMQIPLFAQNKPVYDDSVPKPTLSGISYGEHERHILDFWKAGSKTPTPLVFVIHGGSWKVEEKERVHRFTDVQKLLNAGISVVAINYRLIGHIEGEGIAPPVKAPMDDAARACPAICAK